MTIRARSGHRSHRLDALARSAVVLAAVVLVLTVPLATWWLVGDQSTVPVSAEPDYAVRPLDIGSGTERAAGIGSTVLVVTALSILVLATRRHHLDPRWWRVLVPLAVAGFIMGSGWRVLTAGVIGANIGAGLAVMLGGPVLVAMLVWALAYSIHLLRHRRNATLRPVEQPRRYDPPLGG